VRRRQCENLTEHYPWSGRFISLNRLKDWLALLGFEVVSVEMCCHVPPFENQRWHRRFHFMQRLGARWLPLLGRSIFHCGEKACRVYGATKTQLEKICADSRAGSQAYTARAYPAGDAETQRLIAQV